MTSEERVRLLAVCGRVFSPSAPVNKLTLFAGRVDQTRRITEAVNTRGRHVMMYGDRGVGKTSLATVLSDVFKDVPGMRIYKVNCNETDDFRNVWTKGLSLITVIEEPAVGESEGTRSVERKLSDYINPDAHLGPGEVRQVLQRASQEDFELVIIFDEFDRLAEGDRDLFADMIKDLSDNSVNTTLVLVGVARNLEELIAEHASIDRCLRQIPMPPMNVGELTDIITKAIRQLAMTIENDASQLIVALSQGLPHYTHLLGQEAAYAAINAGRRGIVLADVHAGIREALENSQQSVKADCHKASQGQRKGTLFPQVLLACALAEVDELGYFKSTDVRGPLCEITRKDYDIPNFSQHLDKFATDPTRGPVLEKSGTTRRFLFRFRNPLLRPFIIMKGLRDGEISGELLDKLLFSSIKPSTPKSVSNDERLFPD